MLSSTLKFPGKPSQCAQDFSAGKRLKNDVPPHILAQPDSYRVYLWSDHTNYSRFRLQTSPSQLYKANIYLNRSPPPLLCIIPGTVFTGFFLGHQTHSLTGSSFSQTIGSLRSLFPYIFNQPILRTPLSCADSRFNIRSALQRSCPVAKTYPDIIIPFNTAYLFWPSVSIAKKFNHELPFHNVRELCIIIIIVCGVACHLNSHIQTSCTTSLLSCLSSFRPAIRFLSSRL